MELIYYSGLNCHLASLINLAAQLGLPYEQAFATLWSERDFTDEAEHDIYTSRRVFERIAGLGLCSEAIPCGPDAAPLSLPHGTLLLVGMDAFHTPWHPVGGHFHSAHYFFAVLAAQGCALCSDPVYGQRDIPLPTATLTANANALFRVYRLPASPPPASLADEAEQVLGGHPRLQASLLARLDCCTKVGDTHLRPLIKQVTALFNNRCLFARYLWRQPAPGEGEVLFDDQFLARWEGVKGGLYKATIVRDRGPVLEAVAALLVELLEAEQHMARRLLGRT